MSDPRGIMNVPEVSGAVQAAARLERLKQRDRREQQQKKEEDERERRRRNIEILEEKPDDGEEHLEILA